MKLIATLVTACLAINMSLYGASVENYDNCSAELSVEKNRSSKSADEEGAQFVLVLTNTSSVSKTFSLSARQLAQSCKKGNAQYNRGTQSGNAALNIAFQTNGLQRKSSNNASEITLSSGESYKFIVNVTVPEGTPYNVWSCIEVEATASDCKSLSETTTLSVFTVDPSEE